MKVGDVVKLKSGGEPMTVESVNNPFARCVWFQRAGLDWMGPLREDFVIGMLEPTKPAD